MSSVPPKHATSTSYRHRQVGLFPVLSLAGVAYLLSIGPTDPFRSAAILVFSVVTVFMVALRGTLTVQIDDEYITWWLGLGVLESQVPLAEVAQVEILPVGFAKPGTPPGYYYGASTQSFVELSLTDGRRVVLRSSEPIRLADAIERCRDTAPRRAAQRSSRIRVLEVRSSAARLGALLLIAAAPLLAQELFSPWFRIKGCLMAGTRWHLSYACPKKVTQVELLDQLPPVERRLESYALGWNPPGRVVVAGFGEVDLYLSQPWPPYVLVRSDEQTLLLNCLWPGRTRRLYERLSLWPDLGKSKGEVERENGDAPEMRTSPGASAFE